MDCCDGSDPMEVDEYFPGKQVSVENLTDTIKWVKADCELSGACLQFRLAQLLTLTKESQLCISNSHLRELWTLVLYIASRSAFGNSEGGNRDESDIFQSNAEQSLWTDWEQLASNVMARIDRIFTRSQYCDDILISNTMQVLCTQADAGNRAALIGLLSKTWQELKCRECVVERVTTALQEYRLYGKHSFALADLIGLIPNMDPSQYNLPLDRGFERLVCTELIPLQVSECFGFVYKAYRQCLSQLMERSAAIRVQAMNEVIRQWPMSGSGEEVCLLVMLPSLLRTLANHGEQDFAYSMSLLTPKLEAALCCEREVVVFSVLWLLTDRGLYNCLSSASSADTSALLEAMSTCCSSHRSLAARRHVRLARDILLDRTATHLDLLAFRRTIRHFLPVYSQTPFILL